MRKLKIQMQMTLDGFVCGPNGEQDWVWINGTPDPEGFKRVVELAESSDTLLLGRKMAAEFIQYWKNTADNMPDSPVYGLANIIVNMRKIVFSRTGVALKGRNVETENGDLATVVQSLKEQAGKDILVYGGADFVSSLIGLNLVDEYYIFRNPVAIGEGLAIFKDRKILKLKSSTAFTSGKTLEVYTPS